MGPTFRIFSAGRLASHNNLTNALAVWGMGAKSSQALALLEVSLAASGEARRLQALLEGYRYATDTTVRKRYFWTIVGRIRSHPHQIERALAAMRRRYVMGTNRFDETTRLATRIQPILFAGREIQAHAQIPNGIQAAPKEKGVQTSGPAPPVFPSGKYQILRSITPKEPPNVYLVRDRQTGKQVAIKMAPKSEMKLMESLNHPGIPKILDGGDDFQLATRGFKSEFPSPFFVMEYVQGLPLDDLTRSGKGLPWREAKEIFLQLCSVLGAIHAVGIEHGDIKPENILVTVSKAGGVSVKLIDFGIAIQRGKGIRFRTLGMGGDSTLTPAFVAPERLGAFSRIDHRSDIYSLGVLMYETLTGRLPFSGDEAEMLDHHFHAVPSPPSQVRSKAKIPTCADAIILKLLQKAPDQRFSSAAALAEAIRVCNE